MGSGVGLSDSWAMKERVMGSYFFVHDYLHANLCSMLYNVDRTFYYMYVDVALYSVKYNVP